MSSDVRALSAPPAAADADLRDRHAEGAHAPWFVGQTVDHLYPTCPGLLRGLNGRAPKPAPGVICPEAGDVCGMCLRYWRARTGRLAPLTDMQRELLLCIAAGMTRAAAARRMGVSDGSVRGHLEYAINKLHARNATHAVVLALKHRVIALDDIDTETEIS